MESEISHFEAEMNRGFLQILVLVVLEKAMYGYLMLKKFEKMGYVVEENTLYPLLRRLEKKELIRSEWDVSQDRPKKFYNITDKGKEIRKKVLQIWREQHEIIDILLEANKNV
ncbi:MAG: PadR family transcriptional regulator [Candidatus Aminicenantes bacterium]|nr:PadR family transcriptional regulator [Candidatus Aminicenantes bacterium]